MKRILLAIITAAFCLNVSAQGIKWHNAADFTIIGKPIPTSKPFTRIDGSVYKFNNKTIDRYAGYSTGLAILFETDSPIIKARWTTGGGNSGANMAAIGQKGLDLYIMKDGKWVFAGVGSPDMKKAPFSKHEGTIVTDMTEDAKQCLLYLPLFDCVESLEIGVESGSVIKAIDNPFRHNIIVHGSSITHGASASRPGMTYAARFGRDNGLYTLNLGFSGMCKLQKEYAYYLADIKDVDAFIFDTFSNPQADVINENFDQFVDVVRAAHPDVPMIFLQTERRETRNFNTKREASEAAKQAAAEAVVKRRMKTDKNIYFLPSDDFLGKEHIATADGTHPTDLGFTYMLDSITPKIKKILKKYKIK
jgi:lysophospholipase L1-like esterase